MSDTHQIVDITDIDLADLRYRVSLTPKDTRALASSIQTAGLLSLPILKKNNPGYIVISGHSRVQALVSIRTSKVQAMVVSEQTSELECGLKAISAEAFQRPLGPAEIIQGIKILIPYTDSENISKISGQIFNTQISESFVRDMIKISQLPEPALELLHTGMISIKTARRLTELSDAVQQNYLTLFSNIKASSSKQLEIITHISEIAARDRIKTDDLFAEPYLMNLLSDDQLPPGVKADRLRTYLQEKRFPFLSETRNRVQAMIEKLKLGRGIKFLVPENFESPDYTLSFTARSPKEFETRLKKIEQAAQKEAFKHIFTP